MTAPAGYRIDSGLLWPETDVGGPQVVRATAGALAAAYRHCRAFDVAVQAGGHCGIWPEAMGRKFKAVYTFEPDPMNFRCLCANAPAENVVKFNAALALNHGGLAMERRPENVGAHRMGHPVGLGVADGSVPVLRIDDLCLDACDLICLDVEGYEGHALQGASLTIRLQRPVIVFEDKGLSEAYGIAKGETGAWLSDRFGYRVAGVVDRDVIMVPSC